MPEDWKWYRIRGWLLERAYIALTRAIWGDPHHPIDLCGCDCGHPNCEAWKPVAAYVRVRLGIV